MGKNSKFKNNAERIAYLNQKHEEIITKQENTLLIDFDEALKEEEKKQLEMKLLGKIFKLPPAMPFNFSTFFLRYCYKKVKGKMVIVLPEDKIIDFLRLMFGNDFLVLLENTTNRNVTTDFVYKTIVPRIMKEWGQEVDTEKAESFNVDNLEKKMLTQG